jgi:hypothetical protein
MTETDALPQPDNELIDRIVDGALSPAALRAAIVRLDGLPDGWKRCAVAFLEAQCWRDSFQAMGRSASSPDQFNSSPVTLDLAPTRPATPRWLRGVLAATIVGASFTIGWLSHGARPQTPAELALSRLPNATFVKPVGGSQPQLAAAQVDEGPIPAQSAQQPASDDEIGNPRAELVQTVARLRIGDDNARTEVPILAGPGITEDWLKQQPPPVSEHGQAVFQRHGYQVDQLRRLITTVTADGQRMTVPVDQVQIRYVGNQSL